MKNTSKSSTRKITREEYQKKIRKKYRKVRLRPWFFVTLVCFFVIVIIVNIKLLFDWNNDNKKISKLENELEDVIDITEIDNNGQFINPPEDQESDYWYYVKFPFYNVEFEDLLKKNPDTVGFINVKNTNINYPIVQAKDNDYYLNHAFDRSYNEAGWVYLDYRNSADFSDDNTIIYGHGRLNKTVFGSLKDLLTDKWQQDKDNYVINISTPSIDYVYQIFSIYTIESESYYITPTFSNSDSKVKWLKSMKDRNTSIISSVINRHDKVITLSTCLNDEGGRIVVHAKLIKQYTRKTAN